MDFRASNESSFTATPTPWEITKGLNQTNNNNNNSIGMEGIINKSVSDGDAFGTNRSQILIVYHSTVPPVWHDSKDVEEVNLIHNPLGGEIELSNMDITTVDSLGTLMMANGTSRMNATSSGHQLNFYKQEQIAFMACLLIAIIIGNISVLVAIGLSKRGQRSRMNFFIMHLAIADLSVGLVSLTTDLIWKITVQWYAGDVMCRIVRYLQAAVTYASTYVLVALSIDRLDAIARPMHFHGSGMRAKILIGTAWLFSCVFSLPMLFINKKMVVRGGMVQCWINFGNHLIWKPYITLIASVLFFIPAIIITICYVIIIAIIWSKSKDLVSVKKPSFRMRFHSFKSNGQASEDSEALSKKPREVSQSSSRGVIPQAKIRTIKMTCVIVIVFILCWCPYFIFDLLDVYGHIPQTQSKVSMSIFFQSLAPLNSVANPIIYGIFSTRICRNLRTGSYSGKKSFYV